MPNPLSGVVLTGTDYTDTATIDGVWGDKTGYNGGGTFDITGGAVYYSLLYNQAPQGQPSGYGSSEWTADIQLRAGQGVIPANAYGVRFKNADASSPATVYAYLAPPNTPTLQLNAPNDVGAIPAASVIVAQATLTSDVAITATTEATAQTIVSAAFTAVIGQTYRAEMVMPKITASAAIVTPNFYFAVPSGFAASRKGVISMTSFSGATDVHDAILVDYFTAVAAGASTYFVRAWVSANTMTVFQGGGATGTPALATLTITTT